MRSDLVVRNEVMIWEAVEVWLNCDGRKEQLTENANRLLPLIRFSQLTTDALQLLKAWQQMQDAVAYLTSS